MSPKAPRPEGSGGANRPGVDFRGQQKSSLTYHNPLPKQSTLAREYWRALRSMRVEDLTALTAAGVGWPAITDAVPALAKIRVDGAEFEFNDSGGEAFVLPVRTDSPTTPESIEPLATVRESPIVDLVAFHPRHPAHWALRYGSAEWLGAVEPQYLDPEPVMVWRSPLSWLRSGCRGLVPLSCDPASQYRVLSILSAIVAEDHRHAADLRRVLARPWPIPKVLTAWETRRAA